MVRYEPATTGLNSVSIDDLAAEAEADGLRASFTLMAGSYATVLLREAMKQEVGDDGAVSIE